MTDGAQVGSNHYTFQLILEELTSDGSFLPWGPHGGIKGLLGVVQFHLKQDSTVNFRSWGVERNLGNAGLLVL